MAASLCWFLLGLTVQFRIVRIWCSSLFTVDAEDLGICPWTQGSWCSKDNLAPCLSSLSPPQDMDWRAKCGFVWRYFGCENFSCSWCFSNLFHSLQSFCPSFGIFRTGPWPKLWASKLQEESGQGRGKNSEGTRTKCTKWMSRCTRTYPAFLYWDSNFFCFLRHLNLSILSILTICVLTAWLVFVASLKEEDTLNRFEGGALKSEQVWRLWHGTGGRHPQLFAEGVDPWKDFWKLYMLRVWYSYSVVLFHSWLYSVIICHYMVIICHQTVIIYHSFSFYLRVYSHSFLSVLIVFRSKLQWSEWSWISVRSWSSPALFGAGSAMSRCW